MNHYQLKIEYQEIIKVGINGDIFSGGGTLVVNSFNKTHKNTGFNDDAFDTVPVTKKLF